MHLFDTSTLVGTVCGMGHHLLLFSSSRIDPRSLLTKAICEVSPALVFAPSGAPSLFTPFQSMVVFAGDATQAETLLRTCRATRAGRTAMSQSLFASSVRAPLPLPPLEVVDVLARSAWALRRRDPNAAAYLCAAALPVVESLTPLR